MAITKKKMEKLGIETSLLGFGCMRFPTTPDGKIDEAEAERMLDKAYAAGVTYYDTAYPYHGGESEVVLGKVMKKYDRSTFTIATKLPVWLVTKVEDVDKYFNEQLEKLQTEYIDFYLLHALGKERWDQMVSLGVVERVMELKAAGKIKYVGFSFHDKYEVFEEILNYTDWDFCQIQYNYMDTEEGPGTRGYELAEKKQVPLVIMEPIKGGSLANFADDIADMFAKIDPNRSLASYALRWVASKPDVKVVLSGMSAMDQVEDNLNTFTDFEPLTEKEEEQIAEIVTFIKSRVQNGCTGCRYCMPCPFGVDIPGNFRAWNTYHMFQNYNMVKGSWENGIGEAGQAKNCKKCGKCEKECPQHLPIRDDLVKVQADFDARIF